MTSEIYHKIIREDDVWIYGETWEREIKLSDWIKPKKTLWFDVDSFENLIHFKLKIPLNPEMIKQAKTHEGDINFLYKLAFMCRSDKICLSDKQINFMARILLQNYDIEVLALKHFCETGIIAGVPTKDIEKKLREIRSKHENSNKT